MASMRIFAMSPASLHCKSTLKEADTNRFPYPVFMLKLISVSDGPCEFQKLLTASKKARLTRSLSRWEIAWRKLRFFFIAADPQMLTQAGVQLLIRKCPLSSSTQRHASVPEAAASYTQVRVFTSSLSSEGESVELAPIVSATGPLPPVPVLASVPSSRSSLRQTAPNGSQSAQPPQPGALKSRIPSICTLPSLARTSRHRA
mmetsp:Transcript_10415/g.23580  ORF Transcript_10415/g.23580 Transcript_10415/m.23580 type:complete len:202 (+) Transcript_10415:181-786(+)